MVGLEASSHDLDNCKQRPLARHALQGMCAPGPKRETRAGNQVSNRAGNENFSRCGLRHDPLSQVDANSPTFSWVQNGPLH